VAEEPLGWFVELTDVHDRSNETPLDLSLDRDVRGLFSVIACHCWGEAQAENLRERLSAVTLDRNAVRASLVEFQQGTRHRR